MAHLSSVKASTVATSRSQADKTPASDRPAALSDRLRDVEPRLLALGVGISILTWAYWPNLQDLYTVWDKEPNYSHGKLVIPIALLIFWQRLTEAKGRWNTGHGSWWSWGLFVLILAARAFAYERNNQWIETASLLPAVACLILTIGGWPLMSQAWPAVAFLVFMFPLPPAINTMVAMPLQRTATMGSVFVMLLTGLHVRADGNIIHVLDAPLKAQNLEVAQACNGLSMLMTLAATVAATIILFPLPNWKRLIVLASAIPIALASNVIRIVATGWCYYLMEGESARKFAHDWSGYLMMPMALILVGLELLILSWLAGDGSDDGDARPVFAIIPQKSASPPRPAKHDLH